jgi:ATP dependent DNA ligase domain
VSCLSWLSVKYSPNSGCNAPPFAFLAGEFISSFSSEAVEPRFAIVVGYAPLRGNEASILKPLQRGVKRAMIDDQNVLGLLLDSAGNTLSMLWSKQQRPKDEQVQCTLKVSRVFAISALTYRHSTPSIRLPGLNVHLKNNAHVHRRIRPSVRNTAFTGDLDIELVSMAYYRQTGENLIEESVPIRRYRTTLGQSLWWNYVASEPVRCVFTTGPASQRHITANATEELKIDGFRALAHIEAGEGKLISRNGNTFRGFTDLATWIAEHLHVEGAVLDGEIACVDDAGRPVFLDLLFRRRHYVFIAFDLLYLNGKDLRMLPLIERKALLKKLLRRKRLRILYLDHVEGAWRLMKSTPKD